MYTSNERFCCKQFIFLCFTVESHQNIYYANVVRREWMSTLRKCHSKSGSFCEFRRKCWIKAFKISKKTWWKYLRFCIFYPKRNWNQFFFLQILSQHQHFGFGENCRNFCFSRSRNRLGFFENRLGLKENLSAS